MTDVQLQTAITNLATGSPNTAEEMRNILNEFYARSSKYGDIRMKDVSNAYISENFDGTGLGINLEVGWAIVNGQNLTRQWNGRVPLAFGTAFPVMGHSGGYQDATLVEHTHVFSSSAGGDSGGGAVVTGSFPAEGGGSFGLLSAGESGVEKNYQPYIVTLITMKVNV